MEGRVRRIYKDLQYGFLNADGKDYFFHKDDFDGDWRALCMEFEVHTDILLSFEPIMTTKGLRAKEVSQVDY